MFLKSNLFLALLLVASVGALCPGVQLEVSNDTCETAKEFNKAFQPIFKGMQNYLSWEETYGYGPSTSLNSLTWTSSETVESETYVTDGTTTTVETSTGGYTAVYTEADVRFLKAMEGGQDHERRLFDCPPPGVCKNQGWCCWFCPCKTRRLSVVDPISNKAIAREAAKMEEEAIAELNSGEQQKEKKRSLFGMLAYPIIINTAPQYANVCEWLQAQSSQYTGCLENAVFSCELV